MKIFSWVRNIFESEEQDPFSRWEESENPIYENVRDYISEIEAKIAELQKLVDEMREKQ